MLFQSKGVLGLLFCGLIGAASGDICTPATINLSATSPQAYIFDFGNNNVVNNPPLTLVRGQTYTFNNAVSGGHPFWINSAQGTGNTNGYATGVTGQGTATVTFAVPANAPATLFYNCQYHVNMTNTITTVTSNPACGATPSSSSSSTGTSGGVTCNTPTTINLSATSPQAYIVDFGNNNVVNNPPLTLVKGQTYTFINAVPTGHPFWINSAQGTGNTRGFATGVTNNGNAAGNNTVIFTVPATAPATLYYNCEYHIAMTAVITVVDPAACAATGSSSTGATGSSSTGRNGRANGLTSSWSIISLLFAAVAAVYQIVH